MLRIPHLFISFLAAEIPEVELEKSAPRMRNSTLGHYSEVIISRLISGWNIIQGKCQQMFCKNMNLYLQGRKLSNSRNLLPGFLIDFSSLKFIY
jgi:hypothetical protein